MSSESTRLPDTIAARGRHARYLAALTATAAAVLTVCLLVVPLNGAESTAWTALGALALALLLAATVLFAVAAVPREDGVPPTGHRGRLAGILGTVAAAVGLLMVLGMVTIRLFVPAPEQTVTVQFSDPTGRVILEYCPTLPGSFEATARPADLSSASPKIPVRVTADICGNPEFDQGVLLYLQRSGITIGLADN